MPDNKDIFAPPTPEELSAVNSDPLMAPPSADELKAAGVVEPPSTLRAAGLGVVQGATFGLAPKAEAAVQAAIAKLKGSDNEEEQSTDYADLYKKYLDVQQKQLKAAKEAHPIAYGAGQIGGTILPALATAGAGLVPTGATLAGKIGAGALIGAGAGGLTGLGESQGDLTTAEGRQQAGQDIIGGAAGGALTGGLIGGAVPLTGAAAKKVGGAVAENLEDLPIYQRLKAAYQRGTEGGGFRGYANEEELSQGRRTASGDVAKELLQGRQTLGSKIEESLQQPIEPDKADIAVQGALDVANSFEEANGGTPDLDKVKSILQDYRDATAGKEVPADQLYDLRNSLKSLKTQIQDPEATEVANRAINTAEGVLKEYIPDFKNAFDQYKNYSQAVETVLPDWIQNTPDVQNVLGDKIADLTRKAGGSGMRAEKSRELLNMLTENLDQSGATEEAGVRSPLEIKQDLMDQANLAEVRRKLENSGPVSLAGKLVTGQFGQVGEAGALKAANLAGHIVGSVSPESGSVVSTFGQRLFSAPPDMLRQAADALNQSGFERLGASIHNALDEGNNAMLNAAIFSALQNPKTRAVISGGELGKTQ